MRVDVKRSQDVGDERQRRIDTDYDVFRRRISSGRRVQTSVDDRQRIRPRRRRTSGRIYGVAKDDSRTIPGAPAERRTRAAMFAEVD